MLVASFGLALSEPLPGTPAEACLAVNRDLSLGARLPRTSARLKSSERLSIVAGGSFSTGGFWWLCARAPSPEVVPPALLRRLSNDSIVIYHTRPVRAM